MVQIVFLDNGTPGKSMIYSHRYVTMGRSAFLPTPAEWSASLEQPCRMVMVTLLLLLSLEDNFMMNCFYLSVFPI